MTQGRTTGKMPNTKSKPKRMTIRRTAHTTAIPNAVVEAPFRPLTEREAALLLEHPAFARVMEKLIAPPESSDTDAQPSQPASQTEG